MSRAYTQYKYIVPFLLVCFVSAPLFAAQNKPIDTLAQIETYRQDAIKAITSQDFDIAVVNLNNANKLVSQIKNTSVESRVLLASIDFNYQIQNYKKASSESERVISLLQKQDNKQDLARAYNTYALVLTALEEFNQASIFFKKADAMYTLLNDDENQSRVLLGIGTLELRQGNPKNALNYFDAAIPLFQSFNFSYEEASAQLNKAEALVSLEGEASNQVSLAKNALEIAKSILESNSYSDL